MNHRGGATPSELMDEACGEKVRTKFYEDGGLWYVDVSRLHPHSGGVVYSARNPIEAWKLAITHAPIQLGLRPIPLTKDDMAEEQPSPLERLKPVWGYDITMKWQLDEEGGGTNCCVSRPTLDGWGAGSWVFAGRTREEALQSAISYKIKLDRKDSPLEQIETKLEECTARLFILSDEAGDVEVRLKVLKEVRAILKGFE